jgi:MFS family permease
LTKEKFAEKIGLNRTVLALSVARLGDAIGNSILFIVIPLYVAKLPAPLFRLPETARVGILISLYGLVNALLQPVMGAFSDWTGRRKLFIQFGLLLMGLATLAFIYAGSFSILVVLRSFQGIGVSLTIPASMAVMAMATSKGTRGGSMGIYSTMRMLGFAIGPLMGGFLYDKFGFEAAFLAGSAFIFVGMLMVQLWVKDPSSRVASGERDRIRILDSKVISPGILGAALATFIMAGAFSMLTPLETQINTKLNETASAFAIVFSALMVSRLIFQVPLGRLSDRIGRKSLIIMGLLLMAPTTILTGLVNTTAQLAWTRVGQGIASAAIAAPAFAVAADLSKAGGEGRQMSIITMGFGLGIAIGPLIAGFLATNSMELPFIIFGLLSLVGAGLVFFFVPETVQKRKGKGEEPRFQRVNPEEELPFD